MNNFTSVTSFPVVAAFSFESFIPTLTQCYLIIMVGYLVARFQLLSAADQRGATAYVSYVGMPGIICVTLSDANFADFRWELLLSLLLGKLLVFILVGTIAMGITGNVGIAGVLAVFCVHCNDLPVGNPLMSSLYRGYRPEMMKYLFFMPVVTMVIFVPMGHFMIETYKIQRSQTGNQQKDHDKKQKIARRDAVFSSLMKAGPVVIATTLGVLFNYLFHSHMQEALHKPLTVLAETVPGMVLSIVGFSFVRKERYLITSAMVTACLLLVIKMFLTPILLHTITRLIAGESQSSKELSDFGLLYGIVSPATAIFQTGQEFRTPLSAMSAALIFTTLLSFPASFVIAKFTIVPNKELNEYLPHLKTVMFYIACFSIACDIFVLLSILCKKKRNRFPHSYVACLVFTQIMTCCGVILWHLDLLDHDGIHIKTILFYGGEISGYIWAATAAILMISSESHNFLKKNRFVVIAFVTFSICGMLTAAMCILVSYYNVGTIFFAGQPQTAFEYIQLTVTTVILAFSFVVVGVCLLLRFKIIPTGEVSSYIPSFNEYKNPVFYIDEDDMAFGRYKKKRASTVSIRSNLTEKDEAEFYYKETNCQSPFPVRIREQWSFKFFSLLLLLLLTMFIRLVANLYKIGESSALEIMIPLEFFQSALFIGQGIFFFLTFGISARTASIRVTKCWRRWWHGQEEVVVEVSTSEEKADIVMFCNKFSTFYLSQCFRKLAKDRKWMDEVYKDCFWGHQLVDWMIEERLAQDDVEAEELGQKLLLGEVIRHVASSHQFYDAPYLYYFIKKEEENSAS